MSDNPGHKRLRNDSAPSQLVVLGIFVFSKVFTTTLGYPASYSMCIRGSWQWSCWSINLTTHHTVLRSGMSGSIPPLHHMLSWHAKGHPYLNSITLQSHQRPNPSNVTTSEYIQTSVKSSIHAGYYYMICNEIANIERLIAEVSLIGAFIFCIRVQNI